MLGQSQDSPWLHVCPTPKGHPCSSAAPLCHPTPCPETVPRPQSTPASCSFPKLLRGLPGDWKGLFWAAPALADELSCLLLGKQGRASRKDLLPQNMAASSTTLPPVTRLSSKPEAEVGGSL